MAVAALIHQKFPLDKAPPQPPFQTHFCGMYLEQLMSRKGIPLEFFLLLLCGVFLLLCVACLLDGFCLWVCVCLLLLLIWVGFVLHSVSEVIMA